MCPVPSLSHRRLNPLGRAAYLGDRGCVLALSFVWLFSQFFDQLLKPGPIWLAQVEELQSKQAVADPPNNCLTDVDGLSVVPYFQA
ncbi:MAG: hypothetical protein NNA23_02875 [Nitrospira sp.]|nr:hypothetical protein [Nitrospira sp.]MCP9463268.1 hypothetical protein [Nitrospira sp.]